ncbi:hypothetical protein PR048_025214 [Dryococelus australis]|uniref:alpha-glucosidase n=1 Tax=Dryococelus australis TaxID=614101 RepID=A0ABQ9GQP2_9NEOP|nr:hypothetical protein PR048_025214 [Dryococelus australis]
MNSNRRLIILLLLDLVPNHVSNESEWFKKSVKKIDPYTDYFVWVDPKNYENGTRQPPNNWLSDFGGSAWEWREERRQYYLHQFAIQQVELNYRNKHVVEEVKNVMIYWLDKGINGFRMDAVLYLFEDKLLRDEPLSGDTSAEPTDENYLDHIYTQNQPESFDMIQQWREVLDEYKRKDGATRAMSTEAYADISTIFKYYGTKDRPGAHATFNFFLIENIKNTSNAIDYNNITNLWLRNIPEGDWPNWVIGNHDQHRVASRVGRELVDAMNALALLLPGTAVTYNGEEIGMEDTFITWNQTVDPRGLNAGPQRYQLFSRDPARTPFQWDNTTSAEPTRVIEVNMEQRRNEREISEKTRRSAASSGMILTCEDPGVIRRRFEPVIYDLLSSGFSTNSTTWLPVNPYYKQLNLKKLKTVYKQLVKLRRTRTLQRGNTETAAVTNDVFAFVRSLEGEDTYIVAMNVGNVSATVDLSKSFHNIPQTAAVVAANVGSKFVTGSPLNYSPSGTDEDAWPVEVEGLSVAACVILQ